MAFGRKVRGSTSLGVSAPKSTRSLHTNYLIPGYRVSKYCTWVGSVHTIVHRYSISPTDRPDGNVGIIAALYCTVLWVYMYLGRWVRYVQYLR